ncbi:MAG: VWA domain-containing protein [Steroidobacterales bacterium]
MDVSALRLFHFLHPAWLALLPPLLLFAGWMHWRQSRTGAWSRIMDPDLVSALRLDAGGGTGGPWLLLAAVWTFAVLALAGPAWQRLQSTGYRAPDDWVVVLDLSPSMAVADLAPDRVSRARFAIDDLLGAAHDARVGLIAFAGEAHTVVPLTTDVATIRGLLQPLSPALMPESGNALGPALDQAGRLLRQSGSRHGQVIVLSDGCGDPPQALAAAQKLAAQGAEVQVIGIGTADGAPLKDAKGGFVHDDQGRSLLAKLPRDQLQHIAGAGRGRYWSLDELQQLIAMLEARHANPFDEDKVATERQVSSWRNEGIWLLPLILAFALMVARRGWV